MTDNDKIFKPQDDEDALEFVRRIIDMEPDREPLRTIRRDIPPLFVTRHH